MPKPNSGRMSKNKRKEKDTHPDITGVINVTAPGEHWFSAWHRKDDDGAIWYSIGLKPKEAQSQQQASKPAEEEDAKWE